MILLWALRSISLNRCPGLIITGVSETYANASERPEAVAIAIFVEPPIPATVANPDASPSPVVLALRLDPVPVPAENITPAPKAIAATALEDPQVTVPTP